MSEPLDPRDPTGGGEGSPEISAAADRARQQLREDFEQLRTALEEERAEEGDGSAPVAAAGFLRKARASLAVVALTAAVATAATHFALNGGGTSKGGSVSGPPQSPGPEAGAITAGPGISQMPSPLLSLMAPSLLFDPSGSNGSFLGIGPPVSGPAPLFVIGKPVPVGGHRPSAESVANADPVRRPPAPTLPGAEPPQQFAYSPPPPPSGDGNPGGGGDPGGGYPGGGEAAGKPPGQGKAPDGGDDPSDQGDGGKGLGKGHIKGRGKGHGGGSPGKGHEKDQGGGEPAQGGNGDGGPAAGPARPKPATRPSAPDPPPAPPPAAPAPPAEAPPSGSSDSPGKSGEEHGHGKGKDTAPGQTKK